MDIALYDCLIAQPLRTLHAISRARGFPFDTHATKAASARRLADLLLAPDATPVAWDALSDEARGALRDLARCPDPVHQEDLTLRYGTFRPHRPWRPGAPRQPWCDPISPIEALIYAGLIYPIKLGTARRPVPVIALPDEIRDALADLLPGPPIPAMDVSGPSTPPSGRAIDRQVFVLLSTLNNQDVRPLWERWLPPKATQRLAERLSIPTDPQAPPRSELQVPRLVFLHYLAERARLLGVSGAGGYLKPALCVHPWLFSPPIERQRTLWNAWLAPGAEAIHGQTRAPHDPHASAWRRYRLPTVGEDDPLARFHGLLRALQRLPPDRAVLLDAFLDRLGHRDPALFRPDAAYAHWATFSEYVQASYRRSVHRCLERLLAGPLAWFGVVRAERAGDDPADAPSICLTPLGAALLNREDAPAGRTGGDRPETTSCGAWLHLGLAGEGDPVLSIHATGDAPLPILWSLEEVAIPDVEGKAGRYVLGQDSLLRALDHGHTVEGVVRQLEEDGGDALSPAVLHLLYNWAAAHGQVTLRQATILQTRDPALLQELCAAKRVRDKFTATLSARAVTVDTSAVPLLVRQLEKRGLHASVDPPPIPPTPAEECAAADRVSIVAALELASRISHQLGARLHVPHPLIHDWKASLSLAERDAVESWVADIVHRLERRGQQRADEFEPPFRVPPLISTLEKAIAKEETVEIEYHPPDHPPTVRRVDPLRLEQWGRQGKDYLVAFCHLRGEERTFRVDRIAWIKAGQNVSSRQRADCGPRGAE